MKAKFSKLKRAMTQSKWPFHVAQYESRELYFFDQFGFYNYTLLGADLIKATSVGGISTVEGIAALSTLVHTHTNKGVLYSQTVDPIVLAIVQIQVPGPKQ